MARRQVTGSQTDEATAGEHILGEVGQVGHGHEQSAHRCQEAGDQHDDKLGFFTLMPTEVAAEGLSPTLRSRRPKGSCR